MLAGASMIELVSDFWSTEADYRCITTNGALRFNGRAIMGAGIAQQARSRHPELELELGKFIQDHGNHVYLLSHGLISFPTKVHWNLNSDLDLIMRSARELVTLANSLQDAKRMLLTRPGCGMGRLSWPVVKTAIAPILDDRFIVVSK
jgi:hypothetical protein